MGLCYLIPFCLQMCGLVPNAHVFSALIGQAGKRLDYAYLHELLIRMHKLQVRPNEVIIRQLEFASQYPPSYDKVRIRFKKQHAMHFLITNVRGNCVFLCLVHFNGGFEDGTFNSVFVMFVYTITLCINNKELQFVVKKSNQIFHTLNVSYFSLSS